MPVHPYGPESSAENKIALSLAQMGSTKRCRSKILEIWKTFFKIKKRLRGIGTGLMEGDRKCGVILGRNILVKSSNLPQIYVAGIHVVVFRSEMEI